MVIKSFCLLKGFPSFLCPASWGMFDQCLHPFQKFWIDKYEIVAFETTDLTAYNATECGHTRCNAFQWHTQQSCMHTIPYSGIQCSHTLIQWCKLHPYMLPVILESIGTNWMKLYRQHAELTIYSTIQILTVRRLTILTLTV